MLEDTVDTFGDSFVALDLTSPSYGDPLAFDFQMVDGGIPIALLPVSQMSTKVTTRATTSKTSTTQSTTKSSTKSSTSQSGSSSVTQSSSSSPVTQSSTSSSTPTSSTSPPVCSDIVTFTSADWTTIWQCLTIIGTNFFKYLWNLLFGKFFVQIKFKF